ncbi:MAG: hypothetical protein OXH11_17235, partial [Candidatus Aminicenantes bacterium]|nr:hypothetical protein [Candidatus Aminicenantes bacterium]
MRFKLFVIGLLLLLAPGSRAHQNRPERSLNDDTGEKQLIAPVFTQSDALASYLSFYEHGPESGRVSNYVAKRKKQVQP